MIEIIGIVEEIIFKNEENGYTIAILESEEDILTIVGNMPLIDKGENISIEGDFILHKTYGEQFKVENYKLVLPTTEIEVVKYLSSGIITGIGEKLAHRIVNHFGNETMNIIQSTPERLKEVEGIGKKKLETVMKSFKENMEVKDVVMYLQKFGISPNIGIKIYKKYGNESIAKINENPYRIAEDVYGIGFGMADKIANNMGISLESGYRIQSGIKYILMESSKEGHTCLPKEELLKKTGDLLKVDMEKIENLLRELIFNGEVYLENLKDEKYIYISKNYEAETYVGQKIIVLSKTPKKEIEKKVVEEISSIEEKNNIVLAENQRKAVIKAIEEGFLVITGGPGTGKTTTIKTIIEIFEENELEVVLAAPTGRAAKKMSESTGREAKTIHRLLEYTFGDDHLGMFFGKDDGAPIEGDVVIIDEVSMVDIILMENLLKAITKDTRLILVGDIDQLPSVGAGNVLKDIIESKVVSVVKLDEIFRQAKESMIIVNAHKINKKEKPILNKKEKDFFMIRKNIQEDIVETIIELTKLRLPKYNNYDPFKDIQILSPSKKGIIGVDNLNTQLQKVLNPPKSYKKEKSIGESTYRMGDKVMQIKNNYNLTWEKYDEEGLFLEKGEGVFNGDIGYIENIDLEDNEIKIIFDDSRKVLYDFKQLDELRLAYATTIHKSQGSEFPVVIMPISWGPPMLLTKNLLYTGITRAKELVVLVGEERYLDYMINNDKITERYSGLSERLAKISDYVSPKK